jgi:hypothetical protein
MLFHVNYRNVTGCILGSFNRHKTIFCILQSAIKSNHRFTFSPFLTVIYDLEANPGVIFFIVGKIQMAQDCEILQVLALAVRTLTL